MFNVLYLRCVRANQTLRLCGGSAEFSDKFGEPGHAEGQDISRYSQTRPRQRLHGPDIDIPVKLLEAFKIEGLPFAVLPEW